MLQGITPPDLPPSLAATLLHALPMCSTPPRPGFTALLLDALRPAVGGMAPAGLLALLRSLTQGQASASGEQLGWLSEAAAAVAGGGEGSSSGGAAAAGWSTAAGVEVLWLLQKMAAAGGEEAELAGSSTGIAASAMQRLMKAVESRLLASEGQEEAASTIAAGAQQPQQQPDQSSQADAVAIPRLLRLCQLLDYPLTAPAQAAALRRAQLALPAMRGDSAVLLLRALAALQPQPPPATLVVLAVKELGGAKRFGVGWWDWVEEVAAYCQQLGGDVDGLRRSAVETQQQQ